MVRRPQAGSSTGSSERGAVLAFALVFLIVLTVIAVGNMETTILEERMAGNLQDYNVAFQASEAALAAAETWLEDQIKLPATSTNGSTMVWSNAGLEPDTDSEPWWNERPATWWTANGRNAAGMPGVAAQPQYVIEELFMSGKGQSLNLGTGDPPNQRVYHRITSRGIGGNQNTQVMLQSTYARPYD
jgi:type IV pilus assembly protein PilX